MSRKHHPYSPSSWPSRYVCPGFQFDPESPATKSYRTERGENIHKLMEELYYEPGGETEDFDPEEVERASWAAEIIASADPTYPNAVFEQLVTSVAPQYFGYVDCYFKPTDDSLVIYDGKGGNTGENQMLQLIGYAHGIMQGDPDIETVEMNLILWDLREIRTQSMSREEVCNTVEEVWEWMQSSNRATSSMCVKCKLRDGCNAVSDRLRDSQMINWGNLEPEDFRWAIDHTKWAAKFKDDLEDKARKRLEAGRAVPGYQLKERKGATSIDLPQFWEAFGEQLDPADIINACRSSKDKLAKIYQANFGEELPSRGPWLKTGKSTTVLARVKDN